jgi:polyisoprenoid-binding protein YceI
MKPLLRFIAVFTFSLSLCAYTYFVTQWKYVPENASVKFLIKEEKGVETGVFTGLEGKVVFDEDDLVHAVIEASIKVKTVNTGVELRDESIRSNDFFDADKFPLIKYTSTSVLKKDSSYCALGVLTIKAISKPIEIPFRFIKQSDSTAVFKGSFTINRYDFNVGANNDGVGNMVTIELVIPVKK